MWGAENVSLLVAFSAGLLSFFSPCVLPLIPSYLAFITGVSIEELSQKENLKQVRKKVVLSSLFFILGFSVIFITLGASATFIGKFLSRHIRLVEIIGGVIIILMGLHFAGFFKIPFLYKERAIHLQKKPLGLLGTLLVGVAFGAGWTPCVGPILGSILALAATTQSMVKGIVLLAVYSAGLGIPFLVAGLILHKFFEYFQSVRKYLRAIEIGGAVLLIIVGVALIAGYFSRLSGLFQ